ncbi:MAG: hypothetical protein J0M33_22350 [Anaerolineae bacterium]|nr:hypothetical protein [Anaerolineae bacterium]
MNWTNEEFVSFSEDINGGSLDDIVVCLKVRSDNPSGDPRVVPILEKFCSDKRIAWIDIPTRYGEIAYLAAFALCAEKHACKLEGKIRVSTLVPLTRIDVVEMAQLHGVTIPHGVHRFEGAMQTLAEMGKLSQMVLELDPTWYNGRLMMPEWLERIQSEFYGKSD